VSALDDFLARAAGDLGLDAGDLDRDAVLDLTRDVARGVARPAAPLAAYLAGLAAGRAGGGPDERERAIATVGRTVAAWTAQHPPGE